MTSPAAFALGTGLFMRPLLLALDAGMDGHLAKPLDVQLLLTTLSRLKH